MAKIIKFNFKNNLRNYDIDFVLSTSNDVREIPKNRIADHVIESGADFKNSVIAKKCYAFFFIVDLDIEDDSKVSYRYYYKDISENGNITIEDKDLSEFIDFSC